MTHWPTVERLHTWFGGSLHLTTCRDPLRHKQSKRWVITGRKALAVLEQIVPYLWTKRAQGELVLQFHRECGRSWASETSPELLELRECLYQAIRVLNRKGPVAA